MKEMNESKNKFEKKVFGYNNKDECEIEDQNSLLAALKRSKKEQKELDEIHEKKVID